MVSNVFADEEPNDTTKEVQKNIYQWNYNLTQTQRVQTEIDTTIDLFYLHEPNGSIADYQVDVAGYASPSFSLIFTPRENEPYFLQAYEKAFVSTDEMPDYTAQHPYSTLYYSGGLNSEQSGRFLHTQNVNKYLNLGFALNFYKTIGEYDNQAIKGQHITPWISYYGPRFSTTFKYALNNIKREENGGIANDTLLNYEKMVRMKFTNALSFVRYQDIDFVQKWNLGRKPKEDSLSLALLPYKTAVGYRLHFTSAKHYYSDKNPDTAFYNHVYYDSTATNDTTIYKNMTNSVFIEFQRTISNVKIAADFDLGTNYQSLTYYDYDYKIPEYFDHSEFYKGTFDVTFPNDFTISHQHQFNFTGCDKGDVSLLTEIAKTFAIRNQSLSVRFNHEFAKEGAHWMYFDCETNNNVWHNDLLSIKSNSIATYVESTFGNLSFEAHYYNLSDYITFDTKGNLLQTSENGNAFTMQLFKKTAYKHFLMTNGVVLQNVSIGEQEYPTFATYHSAQVRFAVFRKLINFSLGGELLYYPKYKAPVYDASLGCFLPQNMYEYGSFPLMNVFATIKYKPIRLFVKYSDLYALIGDLNYPIASYPQSNGTLSFGLSWLFNN